MEDSTALVKTETKLETIPHPNGERISARGKRGRFVRKVQAVTEISTAQMADLLLRKGEDGKTTLQALREHIVEVAMKATDEKSLIGLAKILRTLEDSAGITAHRESLLKDREELQPVKIVVVTAPQLMHPEIHEEKPSAPARTQPSFAEVTHITTNPPKE